MLFVSISFALGTQSKHTFQWNMGLNLFEKIYFQINEYNENNFKKVIGNKVVSVFRIIICRCTYEQGLLSVHCLLVFR